MTKFKFRLEAALKIRHLRVQAEKARLQELTTQQQRLEKSLVDLRNERSEASTFIQRVDAPVAQDLRALATFNIGLEARTRHVINAIDVLTTRILEQKKQLMNAERDERCLTKLREKRLAEWKLNAEREIEATAQELWLISHTKRGENSGVG